MLKKFLSNKSGATAIEYTLIAALVGIGLVGALGTLEDDLTGSLTKVGTELSSSATADTNTNSGGSTDATNTN